MAESKFPKSFEACPHCGGIDTMASVAWEEEAEKGRVAKDTPVASGYPQVPLLDPAHPPKIVGATSGVLILQTVYCFDCGTGYCKNAAVAQAKVSMQGPGMGGPGPQGPPTRN